MIRTVCLALFCTVAVSACTWVKLSERGESVRVVRPTEVAECERVGEATAQVVSKVGFVRRSRENQIKDLETLARNAAAEMGGNAIVATSDIKEGKREFTVYRCK